MQILATRRWGLAVYPTLSLISFLANILALQESGVGSPSIVVSSWSLNVWGLQLSLPGVQEGY